MSGYEMFSRGASLRNVISSPDKAVRAAQDETATSSSPNIPSVNVPASKTSNIPTSLKVAWLIPATLIVMFLCVSLTILGSFTSVELAKAASPIATFCAIWPVIHINVLNSDLHSLFEESMKRSDADLKNNPFAGFAANMEQTIANASQLKPGGVCT